MSVDTRDVGAVKALANAQKAGNVIGLAAVTGKVVPRQEIDDLLLNDEPCFNLFLLALQALQDPKEQNNPMGYYQIAGIHGLPTLPWNNDTSLKGSGYCAHSMSTFPTWHRPYLALLEQTLYSKMVELAKTWKPESERPSQIVAAGRFRLPFWDYWKPRGGAVSFPGVPRDGETSFDYDFRIPDIMVASKVMVRMPGDSSLKPIDNPLASFAFPKPQNGDGWGQFPRHRVTARYPNVNQPVTALNQALNKAREPRNTLFNTMIGDEIYNRLEDFGTNASLGGEKKKSSFGGGTRTAGSLEGIHNNYHVTIANGGEMNYPETAAFDPVFWIHHCQIDRLLAIWQASHPDSWFVANSKPDGTTPLVPFYNLDEESGQRQYWSSTALQWTKKLGYSYGDLLKSGAPDSAESIKTRYLAKYRWASQKRQAIPNEMKFNPVFEKAQAFKYDPETRNALLAESKKTGALQEAFAAAAASAGQALPEERLAQVSIVKPLALKASVPSRMSASTNLEARVVHGSVPAELQAATPEEIDESHIERTWYVDNIVERLALNGSFTIYFFIGEHSDGDHVLYATQPTMAGITHNFAAPVEYCDNCGKQEEQGLKVTGTVVITPMLKDYIGINQLADLTPESVKPFLVKNLKWRVVKDGVKVDPRVIVGLAVGISSKLKDQRTGQVSYEEHNDVIADILHHAS